MKVENSIRKYLDSKGLDVITGRDVTSGGNLCDEIIKLIQECDFGVVVYNELRHNISYEWGLLDALKKKVIILKDINIHIDLDEEISDKKGTISTPFYGEDTGEQILEQLKKEKGLEKALENNVEKRISGQKTCNAKKAAELLVKSDIILGDFSNDTIKDLPNRKEIIQSLEKIKDLTAEGNLIKGNAYYSDNKFNEAVGAYTMALKINQNYYEAYLRRAYAYYRIEDFSNSLQDYNKAIELNPKSREAYTGRGVVYISLKDSDNDAIEDYKKAIELDPTEPIPYQNLAEAYILIQNFDASSRNAHKALEVSRATKDIIISKFLIILNLIIQGNGEEEEKELIELCNKNKGYRLSFELKTLKNAFKDLNHSERINNLIKSVEENAIE